MIQKSVCGFIVTPLDGDYHPPKVVLDGKCSKSPVTTGLPRHETNLIFTPILIEITCKVDPQAPLCFTTSLYTLPKRSIYELEQNIWTFTAGKDNLTLQNQTLTCTNNILEIIRQKVYNRASSEAMLALQQCPKFHANTSMLTS